MSMIDSLNKARAKITWKRILLYAKPLSFLKEKVSEYLKVNKRLLLEITMFQLFIDVNQLDVTIETSASCTEWTSEPNMSTSVDVPGAVRAPGKRNKKKDLSLEHKLSIAHHYLKSKVEQYDVRKRLANVYYNELLAADENQELKSKTIQNEINCFISKLGPNLCFPNKTPREIRDREYLSSEKWWTIAVCPNDSNRDRLTRATKLENVSLLQKIRNAEVIRKYEEKVDLADFYRKILEKCSFPIEIQQLARKRRTARRDMEDVKRNMHNLRRLLEKEMINGDKVRERIAHERKIFGQVEHSLEMSVAAIEKERTTDNRLVQLLEDYKGPPVFAYIKMKEQAMEVNEIIRMWQHKVAAAKMIMDMNQQKWRRLTRMLVKIKNVEC